VTLADPAQAQAVAQYLAEETVSLSRNANRDSDQDLLNESQKLVDDGAARLEQAQAAWSDLSIREPLEPLRADVMSLTDLQSRVRQDLSQSRAEAAELGGGSSDLRAAGAKARVAALEKQEAELTAQIEKRSVQLSRRAARDDEARQRLRIAQNNFDAANLRMRDIRASLGLRGERLRVIEPGVVPERPSSPNLPLNLALALGLGLLGAVVFLTLTLRPINHDPAS
jgi:capsule polysaccharide export protein KpsE/RkpR